MPMPILTSSRDPLGQFWALGADRLVDELRTTRRGLSSEEASNRLQKFGPNALKESKRFGPLALFLSQFKSPIVLILIGAAILSIFLRDTSDALIILAIVMVTGLLGFWQERGASNAIQRLLSTVEIKTSVLRDNTQAEISNADVVRGDVVLLSAGVSVPADAFILESRDLFVNEATLTGETFPVEKEAATLPTDTPLASRRNCLFMGTHVISGTATALVVLTGKDTELGRISGRLQTKPPETEFEHGVRHFGYLLLEITLVMMTLIFGINVFLKRPILDSFLFSLSLAVGLTPQLLPAIITINLSYGAGRMAEKKVIVKRLSSIENFGSMDVLASDKTGTLTEGVVTITGALDASGNPNDRVFLLAYLNASFESGFTNPIDEAIRKSKTLDISPYKKVDEIPYDFLRKRLSILVSQDKAGQMITKGAFMNILAVCTLARAGDRVGPLDTARKEIETRYEELSKKGYRVLGVASKEVPPDHPLTREMESEMTFEGFVAFFDPPKAGVADTIVLLKQLGVSLTIITGDNAFVAREAARQVGFTDDQVVTGNDLRSMSDEALTHRVGTARIFAEIEPNQKERIIIALKKSGRVVGYLGDGINDAPALHAADVGISVEGAVDVAKESAQIVLLEKDLGVLAEGVREGRRTFANTLKYVFMATSANFGNMFSMAGISLFIPFLPLLPKQILLTNLMTDFPEMTIARDHVDPEMTSVPRRWDISFIRNFMMTFGPLSSVFDFATFAVLLLVLHANTAQFRTGWFVESVVSASFIVLVIRTRRPFWRSRPGRYLLVVTLLIMACAVVLPFTPLSEIFGFTTLPWPFLIILGGIIILYAIGAEITKRLFFGRIVRLKAGERPPGP